MSARTTAALVSWPGAIARTVARLSALSYCAWRAVRVGLAVAGDQGLVVVAEAGADVLGNEVDLALREDRDARLARAEAELAGHGVARVLEGLRIELGHELGLVEVVRADPDLGLGGLARRGAARRGARRLLAAALGAALPPRSATGWYRSTSRRPARPPSLRRAQTGGSSACRVSSCVLLRRRDALTVRVPYQRNVDVSVNLCGDVRGANAEHRGIDAVLVVVVLGPAGGAACRAARAGSARAGPPRARRPRIARARSPGPRRRRASRRPGWRARRR